MKKMILLLIASVVALLFTACEPTTSVKWKTASTYDPTAVASPDANDGITAIKWEKNSSADTTWSEQLVNSDQETSSKSVGELTGSGTCLLDGADAIIEISDTSTGVKHVEPGGGSAELKEGENVTLIISNTAKK